MKTCTLERTGSAYDFRMFIRIAEEVTVSVSTILLYPMVVSEAISFQVPSSIRTSREKDAILCPKGMYS